MAFVQQPVAQVRAEETGAARDEDAQGAGGVGWVHGWFLLSVLLGTASAAIGFWGKKNRG
jgi:hypothetical protein